MAKAKTKEKKVKKISNEHLGTLQNLVQTANKVNMSIGNLEAQKFGLLKQLEAVDMQLMQLKSTFEEEYGTNNIRIQDGTILGDEQVN